MGLAAALPSRSTATAARPDRLPEWAYLLPAITGRVMTALAGDNVPVDTLAARVGSDDVLYWEVDRRAPGQLALTPARAFARLTGLGLTPIAAYWVKPGFPDRRMYLPLASQPALRWYIDTLYRSETRGRRLLKHALRAVAAWGQLGAVAPCYAIIATRGARPADARAHTVLLAHATEAWSRVALVPMETGGSAPSTVIKLPRASAFNEQVEWEHRVQQHLHAVLPPTLRESIPQSRAVEWRELTALVETAVPGAPLTSRIGVPAEDPLDDLRLATRWLGAFHTATLQVRTPAREWLTRRLVQGLCRNYADAFTLTDAETHLFGRLERYLNACGPVTLPLAWHHTDFGPWNVYRDGRTLRVIDWEVARVGPGVADMLYFAMHWGAAATRRTTHVAQVEYFASLFCTRTAADPVSLGIHEYVAAYLHRTGIHWSLLPAMLAYTVLEQAVDLVRRRAAAGTPSRDRSTNPYVAYLAAMAEHVDALMPQGDSQ
jgi:thiamine kinase-like enzyme